MNLQHTYSDGDYTYTPPPRLEQRGGVSREGFWAVPEWGGWERARGLQPGRRPPPGVQQHVTGAHSQAPKCSFPPRWSPKSCSGFCQFSSPVLLEAPIPPSSGHPASGSLPGSAERGGLCEGPGPTPTCPVGCPQYQSIPLPLHTGLTLCTASGELRGSQPSQGQVDL